MMLSRHHQWSRRCLWRITTNQDPWRSTSTIFLRPSTAPSLLQCELPPTNLSLAPSMVGSRRSFNVNAYCYYHLNAAVTSLSWEHPWTLTSCRYLALSSRYKRKKPDPKSLANERLVAAIVKNAGAVSPDEIQVRLIVNQQQEEQGTSSSVIVSLKKAIETSVELNQDLIGLALEQAIPVVKIDCLKKHAYEQSRKSQSIKKKTQVLPEKEFRFRTGIGENDLQRKIDNMVTFLEKGHNCTVSIRSTRRQMVKDPDTARNTAIAILELVSDAGELESKLKVNPNKTFATFVLRPIRARKKKE